jgi:hypothetical protein
MERTAWRAVVGEEGATEAMRVVTAVMTATAVGRRRWRRQMVRTVWCTFSWHDTCSAIEAMVAATAVMTTTAGGR